jgi:hypothetical protein
VPTLGIPVLEMLNPRPGKRINDLGCGDGALAEKIVASGTTVVGVDAAPDMPRQFERLAISPPTGWSFGHSTSRTQFMTSQTFDPQDATSHLREKALLAFIFPTDRISEILSAKAGAGLKPHPPYPRRGARMVRHHTKYLFPAIRPRESAKL